MLSPQVLQSTTEVVDLVNARDDRADDLAGLFLVVGIVLLAVGVVWMIIEAVGARRAADAGAAANTGDLAKLLEALKGLSGGKLVFLSGVALLLAAAMLANGLAAIPDGLGGTGTGN